MSSSPESVQLEAPPLVTPTCSDTVCSDCTSETDVILESCDGIRFGAHAKDLEKFSGFPPAEFVGAGTDCEIVHMEECSQVLKLMLHYMHPYLPQPDNKIIPFTVLDPLANAVEKHLIYPAMGVCKLRMEIELPTYPLQVLKYSVKHKHNNLADRAAPLTLSYGWEDVRSCFGMRSLAGYQWLVYREACMTALKAIREVKPPVIMHKGGFPECDDWKKFEAVVLDKLARPGGLVRVSGIISDNRHLIQTCQKCLDRSQLWRESIMKKISHIQSYSQFCITN